MINYKSFKIYYTYDWDFSSLKCRFYNYISEVIKLVFWKSYAWKSQNKSLKPMEIENIYEIYYLFPFKKGFSRYSWYSIIKLMYSDLQ